LSFTHEKGTAAFHAKTLLHELSLKTPPIRPREIVKRLEVLLQEVDAADRFDGWILQVDGSAAICINRAIASEPRKNFTIAHELGHFRLSWHNRQPQCLRQDIEAIRSAKTEEAEANEFAAELLMPEDLVRPLVEQGDIGLGGIQQIADAFETSFTSSAYRYIQFTPYPAALVICEQRKIKHVSLSEALRQTRRPFAERGAALNQNSLAVDFFDTTGNITKTAMDRYTVLPSVWFPEAGDMDFTCYEETRGLPALRQTVSLVWIEDAPSSPSDEGDEDN
jgi:Zn-dependent peptidase ImmA (M78 family)